MTRLLQRLLSIQLGTQTCAPEQSSIDAFGSGRTATGWCTYLVTKVWAGRPYPIIS